MVILSLGAAGVGANESIVFRTWWGVTGPRIELLEGMFRQFDEETGIQVKYESPATNTTQYLDRLIIDSVTGTELDVVLTGGLWTADVIDAGIVRPLDDFLAQVPELKKRHISRHLGRYHLQGSSVGTAVCRRTSAGDLSK